MTERWEHERYQKKTARQFDSSMFLRRVERMRPLEVVTGWRYEQAKKWSQCQEAAQSGQNRRGDERKHHRIWLVVKHKITCCWGFDSKLSVSLNFARPIGCLTWRKNDMVTLVVARMKEKAYVSSFWINSKSAGTSREKSKFRAVTVEQIVR
jgi:hypothetical protein